MGYYTYYNIEVAEKNEIEKNSNYFNLLEIDEIDRKLGKALCKINPGYFKSVSLKVNIDSNEMKWYEHDTDMLKLSKLFPDYVFILEGQGEEHPDMWITYYCDGHMQHCPATITYDDFDPRKMIQGDIV